MTWSSKEILTILYTCSYQTPIMRFMLSHQDLRKTGAVLKRLMEGCDVRLQHIWAVNLNYMSNLKTCWFQNARFSTVITQSYTSRTCVCVNMYQRRRTGSGRAIRACVVEKEISSPIRNTNCPVFGCMVNTPSKRLMISKNSSSLV